MKIFKRKHFQALIYSIFLSLPLLSVLGRCVYTIANKNAYQSYSGTASGEYELVDNLVTGEDYTFNKTYNENFQFNGDIYVDITNFATSNTGMENFYLNNADSINRLVFTIVTNTGSKMEFYNGTTYLDYWTIQPNMSLFIEFTATQNVTLTNNTNIRQYSVANSTLDNAFEYSIDRFVSENDYGELDFFTWFSSLFLSGNSLDSLYIHFINWYMNYILYVSLGYLIFSVLLWFVNFFRRLVDDTENINVGGM